MSQDFDGEGREVYMIVLRDSWEAEPELMQDIFRRNIATTYPGYQIGDVEARVENSLFGEGNRVALLSTLTKVSS